MSVPEKISSLSSDPAVALTLEVLGGHVISFSPLPALSPRPVSKLQLFPQSPGWSGSGVFPWQNYVKTVSGEVERQACLTSSISHSIWAPCAPDHWREAPQEQTVNDPLSSSDGFSFTDKKLCSPGTLLGKVQDGLKAVGVAHKFRSLMACGIKAVKGHSVSVVDYGDHLGLTYIQRCSSPMLCPVCSIKISNQRRLEIDKAISTFISNGYTRILVTLTAPHDYSIDPVEQVKNFLSSVKKMQQGGTWKKFKEKFGWVGHIKVLEMTDDNPDINNKSGSHFHTHILVGCDYVFSGKDKDEFTEFLKCRWAYFLEKVGLSVPEKRGDVLARGCDVVFLTDSDSSKVSAYLTKGYVASGAAWELAPAPGGKSGRGGGRRISHWELIKLAFHGGRSDLVSRAIHLMTALKGRRWVMWSPGLKALCGVGGVSDQEVVEEEREEKAPIVFRFDEAAAEHGVLWPCIVKYRLQKETLEAARLLRIGKHPTLSARLGGLSGMAWQECFIISGGLASAGVDPLTAIDIYP